MEEKVENGAENVLICVLNQRIGRPGMAVLKLQLQRPNACMKWKGSEARAMLTPQSTGTATVSEKQRYFMT